MGSLLKPFLILAYGATHTRFPVTHCSGAKDGCWLSRGHGDQDIVNGLANSCNAYFLALAKGIDRAALDSICLSYGLTAPARAANARNLIGLESGWPQTPLTAVAGFASLAQNRGRATVDIVLAGMERCAASGTARAIRLDCYAKTGTAPCTHTPRAPGDGFVIAIYPRVQPRNVTLFEQHGTTGAEAARGLLRKIS
jgi:cell division protein FtsI/penicillin-binding protein 2